jgi:hypothetical protein
MQGERARISESGIILDSLYRPLDWLKKRREETFLGGGGPHSYLSASCRLEYPRKLVDCAIVKWLRFTQHFFSLLLVVFLVYRTAFILVTVSRGGMQVKSIAGIVLCCCCTTTTTTITSTSSPVPMLLSLSFS